jgi:phosphoribosylglycinamide formyltransferase-1
MNKMPKVAVFASGNGSNFQAIVNAVNQGKVQAEVVAVVTDKPEAYVAKRAKNAGISVIAHRPNDFPSKMDYEGSILKKLQTLQVEWLVLAGYMRLIGNTLLSAYPNRILNIHPSLLPAFPGKDAIGQALAHGVKITGVTVHYVDDGMDTGQIVAQEAVDIEDCNREQAEQRIHAIEHGLYIRTLQLLGPTGRGSRL